MANVNPTGKVRSVSISKDPETTSFASLSQKARALLSEAGADRRLVRSKEALRSLDKAIASIEEMKLYVS
jgi:hypothetical protein